MLRLLGYSPNLCKKKHSQCPHEARTAICIGINEPLQHFSPSSAISLPGLLVQRQTPSGDACKISNKEPYPWSLVQDRPSYFDLFIEVSYFYKLGFFFVFPFLGDCLLSEIICSPVSFSETIANSSALFDLEIKAIRHRVHWHFFTFCFTLSFLAFNWENKISVLPKQAINWKIPHYLYVFGGYNRSTACEICMWNISIFLSEERCWIGTSFCFYILRPRLGSSSSNWNKNRQRFEQFPFMLKQYQETFWISKLPRRFAMGTIILCFQQLGSALSAAAHQCQASAWCSARNSKPVPSTDVSWVTQLSFLWHTQAIWAVASDG